MGLEGALSYHSQLPLLLETYLYWFLQSQDAIVHDDDFVLALGDIVDHHRSLLL
jgi:hypothetical protein